MSSQEEVLGPIVGGMHWAAGEGPGHWGEGGSAIGIMGEMQSALFFFLSVTWCVSLVPRERERQEKEKAARLQRELMAAREKERLQKEMEEKEKKRVRRLNMYLAASAIITSAVSRWAVVLLE